MLVDQRPGVEHPVQADMERRGRLLGPQGGQVPGTQPINSYTHHEPPAGSGEDRSAAAIPAAQPVISGQSRKSPSGTRRADTIARSGKASCLRTSLPANTRCSRALVAARTSATSTGSSSGLGGSPTGPLENSQTGRAAIAPAWRSASSLAGSSQWPAYTALPSTTAS